MANPIRPSFTKEILESVLGSSRGSEGKQSTATRPLGPQSFDFTQQGSGLTGAPFSSVFPQLSPVDAANRLFADVLRLQYLSGKPNRTPGEQKVFENLSNRPGNLGNFFNQINEFASSTGQTDITEAIQNAVATGEGLGSFSGQQDLSAFGEQFGPQSIDFIFRELERESQKTPGGFFQTIADVVSDPANIAAALVNTITTGSPVGFGPGTFISGGNFAAGLGKDGPKGGTNPGLSGPGNVFQSELLTTTPSLGSAFNPSIIDSVMGTDRFSGTGISSGTGQFVSGITNAGTSPPISGPLKNFANLTLNKPTIKPGGGKLGVGPNALTVHR